MIYKIDIECNKDFLKDHIKYENDEGIEKKLEFRWINLSNLKTIDFRPAIILDKLIKKDFSIKHFIEIS